MNLNRSNLTYSLAILLALWFALTSWLWAYWFALFFSYPLGLLSFILWFSLKKEKKKRNHWIPRILIAGLLLSLGMLIYLLIWE
jgi:hypothetical protein